MKTKLIFLCIVLLMTQAAAFGQKTQVSVQEGKVKAQTAAGEVIVDAGKKVILTSDKEPVVIVNDPLVEDIMEIYKWVEAEKQAQKEKIDTSFILIIKIENENLWTSAYFTEQQNPESKSSDIFNMPESTILEDPKYYDMKGNLLKFDLKKTNAKRGRYTIHFLKSVEPGDKFRFICVSKVQPQDGLKKEGPLHLFTNYWSVPNQLNYYRVILPESAIFVDSSRPVTIVDNQEGRTAVTIRNYSGSMGDGAIKVAFLWPDKDGTTLADLPPKYRGLGVGDKREENVQTENKLAYAKVLAGETFIDQNTPLKTLLTFISAIIRKDRESFLSVMDESIRKIVARQYEQAIDQYGSSILNFDLLNTPDWPEKSENGTTYAINLCRKGSLLSAITITMVYRDGKWYWLNTVFDG